MANEYILHVAIRKPVTDIAEGKTIGNHIKQKLSEIKDATVIIKVTTKIEDEE